MPRVTDGNNLAGGSSNLAGDSSNLAGRRISLYYCYVGLRRNSTGSKIPDSVIRYFAASKSPKFISGIFPHPNELVLVMVRRMRRCEFEVGGW